MKRLIDLLFAILGLILFSPLLLVVALIVRLFLGSPVIFAQQRPGWYAKPFYIYKFRTMLSTMDEKGNLLSDDQRLTKLGLFLRKFSLDELPQLINVVKGDLSLVGPRPLLMEYIPLYNSVQFKRHNIRPGITGWAQVNGRNAISWEDKFNLDIWYVEHQSFWLDIKIIFLTVKKVLFREGISAQGEATMSKFTGGNT